MRDDSDYKVGYTERAKKVCPKLRDSASACGASSSNLGHTFLAISEHALLNQNLQKKNIQFSKKQIIVEECLKNPLLDHKFMIIVFRMHVQTVQWVIEQETQMMPKVPGTSQTTV